MRTDPAPVLSGAVRSTPEFDLLLQLPEVDHEVQRQRLAKETDKLEKIIVNIDRQLESEKFLNGAPPHVVEDLRGKRAGYLAQIEKNRAAIAQP